jgi:hypothetical protein
MWSWIVVIEHVATGSGTGVRWWSLNPSEKPRKPGQTGVNQIQLVLFSSKIRCWLDVNYKFIE